MMKPSGDLRTDSVEGKWGVGARGPRPHYSPEQESQLQHYYGLFPETKILYPGESPQLESGISQLGQRGARVSLLP